MSSTTIIFTASSTSPGKAREKRQKSASKPQAERLKTVVRRLPPNLPEDIFWQSVQEWVTDETVQWKVYYKGKSRKRFNKENIPSRAYTAFKNEDQLAEFSRDYDGHVFRDKAGNESIAVVEFAPYQKVPSEKKKVDSRMGTIEKDEDYISFLKSLEGGDAKAVDSDALETLIAASQPPPQPTTTPLLEALKAEKSAQKDKEAILRNHAHYKDQPASGSSKKADKKRDGTAAAAAPATGAVAKPTSTEQPLSKKARKAAAKAAQQQGQQPGTSSNAGGKAAAPPTSAAQSQGKQAPSTQSTSPSQPPRAPRERVPKASAPVASAAPAVANPATPSTQVTPAPDASTSAPTEASSSAAPARRRPVLGLASRQFEAALSGAGVAGRPSRRERAQEKDRKDKFSTAAAGETTPAPGDSTPKAREEKRARASQAAAAFPAAPAILQRDGATPTPKILTREGTVSGAATAPGDGDGSVQDDQGGSSGRGRGKGRGKGRGGARGGAL